MSEPGRQPAGSLTWPPSRMGSQVGDNVRYRYHKILPFDDDVVACSYELAVGGCSSRMGSWLFNKRIVFYDAPIYLNKKEINAVIPLDYVVSIFFGTIFDMDFCTSPSLHE